MTAAAASHHGSTARTGVEMVSPTHPLVDPVPEPGGHLAAVCTEWELIEDGQQSYSDKLPRPWDPATCTDPQLRHELWQWLDDFATWVNQQCLWDPGDLIPPCWPLHPHLVHELAVVAVQRRQASRTANAGALEHWQTHTLPTFLTRSHARLKQHCTAEHRVTPGTTAHNRHQSTSEVRVRRTRFEDDLIPTDTVPSHD